MTNPDAVRDALVRVLTAAPWDLTQELMGALGMRPFYREMVEHRIADALLSRPEGTGEAVAWEAFGREVLQDAHEIEGLQEIGVKHGVLVPTPVTMPCVPPNADGEHRGCVCYETDNIPGTCYCITAHPRPASVSEAMVEACHSWLVRTYGDNVGFAYYDVRDMLTAALAARGA